MKAYLRTYCAQMHVSRRAALAVVAGATALLAGCGSSSKSVAAGLPLWQRVVLGGELSGYDPQIQPPQMLNLSQFVAQARPSYIRITVPSAIKELKADGFKTAMIEDFPNGAGGPDDRVVRPARRLAVAGATRRRLECRRQPSAVPEDVHCAMEGRQGLRDPGCEGRVSVEPARYEAVRGLQHRLRGRVVRLRPVRARPEGGRRDREGSDRSRQGAVQTRQGGTAAALPRHPRQRPDADEPVAPALFGSTHRGGRIAKPSGPGNGETDDVQDRVAEGRR